jgi:site-specific recombinase XerD
MTVDAIADVFQKRLGVFRVHTSRHTFADSMRRVGASPSEMQAALGHANLATTPRFLHALSVQSNPHAGNLALLYGLVPTASA